MSHHGLVHLTQPTRSLDAAKRNRGMTVGSQTGRSPARIFGRKDAWIRIINRFDHKALNPATGHPRKARPLSSLPTRPLAVFVIFLIHLDDISGEI